jgi:hypothetical protein
VVLEKRLNMLKFTEGYLGDLKLAIRNFPIGMHLDGLDMSADKFK